MRSFAHKFNGDFDRAYEDLVQSNLLEPDNKEIYKELEKLSQHKDLKANKVQSTDEDMIDDEIMDASFLDLDQLDDMEDPRAYIPDPRITPTYLASNDSTEERSRLCNILKD